MKRFHVHAHVQDLQASIAFYSRMFATEPTRVEFDDSGSAACCVAAAPRGKPLGIPVKAPVSGSCC